MPLHVELPERELFDEETNTFVTAKGTSFQIEHSLISLSKWESKWKKAFLGKEKKSMEEVIDYIRCMTITKNVDWNVYLNLPDRIVDKVQQYIENPMTATTINNKNSKLGREIITAEIIYYWMIALNIPMECQKWHLNRLLTLIQVCNIKNMESSNKGQKSRNRPNLSSRAALNQARRAQYQSKG